MSMARKTLEIYAGQGFGPADTLSRVNDALVADLGVALFKNGLVDEAEEVFRKAAASGASVPRSERSLGSVLLNKASAAAEDGLGGQLDELVLE